MRLVRSEMVLAIWIGLYEVNAIALEIEKSTRHAK
jgi:hypothetical protein